MSITAKELAKKLNISAATVSMVLNHKPGISEETRELVFNEAKKNGYDFSKLRQPSTGIIYFIIYKKHGNVVGDTPFFAQVIEGLETDCRHAGSRLQILYFNEMTTAQEQLDVVINSGCCGVILLGTEMMKQDYIPFSKLRIPLVVLDSYYDELPFWTVLINNVRGAYLATCYLIEQGHTEIGYLQSSKSISNFEERADGFFKALRSRKLKKNMNFVFRVTPVLEKAYEEFSKILDTSPKLPTCFFADNDLIALGCYRALKEHGYRIPDDISIIGFDDIPACQMVEPPMTTVRVPKQLFGAYAVRQLLQQLANPVQEATKVEIATELILRNSVRCIK